MVHGHDGLDEISLAGPTKIMELKNGKIESYTVKPEDFGARKSKLSSIKGGDISLNKSITLNILKGEGGVFADMAIINAAAGIVAGGKADSLKEGADLARQSISSRAALKTLEALKELSNS